MRIAVFMIPARHPEAATAELDRFFQARQIVSVQKRFVEAGEGSFWSCWVEYKESSGPSSSGRAGAGGDRIDYREKLSAADFNVFSELRRYRKKFAEREGVPLYAVFSNEQLAAIAQKRPASMAELNAVDGVGEARAAKHFAGIQGILAEAKNPVPG